MSSLGDVLLTTPVIRCLKQQLEQSVIHYLTRPSAVPLLVENKNIDKIWTLDVSSKDAERQMIGELRAEKFDAVVDLHNNWRSRRIRRVLHVACHVYNKENINKFLYIITKHNFMSGRHVVDRYFAPVAALGVRNDGNGMDLPLPDSMRAEEFCNQTVGEYRVADIFATPYIVVAFGAQHPTKSIPPDKLRMLCYTMGMPVVLLGDEKDRKVLKDWGLRFDRRVKNLCGKTTLFQSAALIERAAAVVSADSAMMHVAAALRRPVVAVFGATDPAFGFTPYKTTHVDSVCDGLRCHPCSRQGGARCPKKHYNCMHLQKWQQIAQVAVSMAKGEFKN